MEAAVDPAGLFSKTEFYFIRRVPWPAFNKEELLKAIEKYNGRERRYGGVKGE